MTTGQEYLIALGGNLRSSAGVPLQTLKSALEKLDTLGPRVVDTSRFFRTPCFPPGAGPDYVNAAARILYEGPPREVLDLMNQVEASYGRERMERWGQRTLDLDLLAAGDCVMPDEQTHARWRNLELSEQIANAPNELVLPHPRIQDRAFVLVPLADVAPDWVHPVLGQSVTDMLEALPDDAMKDVVAL